MDGVIPDLSPAFLNECCAAIERRWKEEDMRHVQTSGSLPALSDNSKKTIRVTRKPGKK